MNINATLFVQAINFFIAYLLFRFILLKPAYQVIWQEQKDQKQLEGRVTADERSLEVMRKNRLAQWHACQQYCKKYLPEELTKVEVFRGITPPISAYTPSSQELRSIQNRISQAIISQVGEG